MDKYFGVRLDVLKLVPESCKTILDVGCGTGLTAAAIKDKTKGQVYGLELSPEFASEAQKNMDEVYVEDVSRFFAKAPKQQYDCIIFADILEHILDPWKVLENSKRFLLPGGVVIISIPNIRFYTTFYYLFIKAEWPYHERGIHDKTHVRFFTRKNVVKLVKDAGFQFRTFKPYYLVADKKTVLNKFRRFMGIPGIRGFFTFQYHMVITPVAE